MVIASDLYYYSVPDQDTLTYLFDSQEMRLELRKIQTHLWIFDHLYLLHSLHRHEEKSQEEVYTLSCRTHQITHNAFSCLPMNSSRVMHKLADSIDNKRDV